MSVIVKTPEEIEKMRVAGRLAAEVLEMIGEYVVPGVSTEELDRICRQHIGLALGFVRSISPDDLLDVLRQGGALYVSRCLAQDIEKVVW